MYELKPYDSSMDLTEFYSIASSKGFVNNSSQKMLIDSFNNEREKQVWILYYNGKTVGSVASHSFDEMGDNCYRICARTCVFTDMLPVQSVRTRNEIVNHQNITGQFFIPACIEWAPKGSRLFITTNENEAGSQRLVHTIFAPMMVKSGQMAKVKDLYYRGTNQTVWELFPDKFYEVYNNNIKWN